MARAVGLGMLDEDIVVALLFAVHEVEAVGSQLAPLALHADNDVVPHMAATEGDGAHAQACVAAEGDAGLGESLRRGVEVLQAVELEAGPLFDVDFQQLRRRAAEGLTLHLLHEPGIVRHHHAHLRAARHGQPLRVGLGRQPPAVAPYIGKLVFSNHNLTLNTELNTKH